MYLSVIIPVGKTDESWRHLVPSLEALNSSDEIIFVSQNLSLRELDDNARLKHLTLIFLTAEEGRAKQLNAGARAARHEALWFVHCDSVFSAEAVHGLRKALGRDRSALYFFDLKFLKDGPSLMRLTEWGVLIRSRILRIPFGDQAFCLSKANWKKLGPFDEKAAFGEDHLYVWTAHRLGVKLRALGHPLYTSARKYQSRGWLTTTRLHWKLTTAQALPNLYAILLNRSRS